MFLVTHCTTSRQPNVPHPTSPRTRGHAARNLQAMLEFSVGKQKTQAGAAMLPGSGAPTPLGKSRSIFQPECTNQYRLQPKPDRRS